MTIAWITPVLVGLAMVLLSYSAWRLYVELGSADTEYRDKPPRGFRVLWPIINIVANTASPFWTARRLEQTGVALRRGGQEYALTAQQFLGGKLVAAMVFGAAGIAVAAEGVGWLAGVLGGLFGYVYPDLWLRDHTSRRNLAILKALPFFLDVVTLSVESGLNLTGALQKAVERCRHGPLMGEVNRVLRDVRGGKPRVEALRAMAERLEFQPISSLVSALVQGELMGSSLGPVLRAQSDQRRSERFLRAEKLAMEAPVKMLGPLILFIFPCTFIVLGFPIVMKFLQSGL